MSCLVVPRAILSVVGVMIVIELGTATVTKLCDERAAAVRAVIVDVPRATPRPFPVEALMFTTPGLEELQLTMLVTSTVPPPGRVRIARNCWSKPRSYPESVTDVSPGTRRVLAGVVVSDVTMVSVIVCVGGEPIPLDAVRSNE